MIDGTKRLETVDDVMYGRMQWQLSILRFPIRLRTFYEPEKCASIHLDQFFRRVTVFVSSFTQESAYFNTKP